jgi:hypothetical protein
MLLSKKLLINLCVAGLFSSIAITSCVQKQDAQTDQLMESPMDQNDSPQLRHVVLFKFKSDADPQAIARAQEAFEALPDKIPQIREFEWGLNNSPEGLNKGFTQCFLLTFDSEEDRAIYLPHPDHKAFGALLKDILEDVTVVDYWTN